MSRITNVRSLVPPCFEIAAPRNTPGPLSVTRSCVPTGAGAFRPCVRSGSQTPAAHPVCGSAAARDAFTAVFCLAIVLPPRSSVEENADLAGGEHIVRLRAAVALFPPAESNRRAVPRLADEKTSNFDTPAAASLAPEPRACGGDIRKPGSRNWRTRFGGGLYDHDLSIRRAPRLRAFGHRCLPSRLIEECRVTALDRDRVHGAETRPEEPLNPGTLNLEPLEPENHRTREPH